MGEEKKHSWVVWVILILAYLIITGLKNVFTPPYASTYDYSPIPSPSSDPQLDRIEQNQQNEQQLIEQQNQQLQDQQNTIRQQNQQIQDIRDCQEYHLCY